MDVKAFQSSPQSTGTALPELSSALSQSSLRQLSHRALGQLYPSSLQLSPRALRQLFQSFPQSTGTALPELSTALSQSPLRQLCSPTEFWDSSIRALYSSLTELSTALSKSSETALPELSPEHWDSSPRALHSSPPDSSSRKGRRVSLDF